MGVMKRAIAWEESQRAKQRAVSAGVHRVYMSFTRGRGWLCEFVEESTRKTLRKLTVATPGRRCVEQVAERGGALHNLESRQMLEYGIQGGRGGVTLKLSAEQLAKLKAAR